MDFGVTLLAEEQPPAQADLIVLAEKNKFRSVWTPDSQLLWWDPYQTFAIAAMRTSRIKLGVGVSNLYTRHPSVIACAIATLNNISNNRAILGLGSGDSSVHLLHEKPLPLSTCERDISLIRGLVSGKEVDYKGNMIKFRYGGGSLPIYFAATGPRAFELAGRIADGVIINVGVKDDFLKYALLNIKKGAESVGRDYEKIRKLCWTACSVSESSQQAKDSARTYVAAVLTLVAQIPSNPSLPTDLVKYAETFRHYDYTEHLDVEAKHTKLVTDQMVEDFVVAGTLEECIRRFNSMEGLGIDEFSGMIRSKDKIEHISTFGDYIIPRFE